MAPPQPVARPESDNGGNGAIKWIGGGIAGLALLGLIGAGTGGGGSLIGALLGGLLGHKLAQGMNKAPTPPAARAAAPATAPAPATTSVQRSGFGTTAASTGVNAGA